ncbi:MAG TPA: hypothetical protein VH575_05575 [Gemmataceae bacterium]
MPGDLQTSPNEPTQQLSHESTSRTLTPPSQFTLTTPRCQAQSLPKLADVATGVQLPVLADALEEAGCQDQDILGHCRSRGDHVRGCGVVDLVLGKSWPPW